MNLDEITPLILTFNEEPNLPRTLERLAWARQILVVDSFSLDATCELVRQRPGAVLLQRKFDTFAGQCNFGLAHIQTPWVLSMDADYILTPEFTEELRALTPTSDLAGYAARFRYCIYGRPLRASLYPPRTVLYRRDVAHYRDDGHGHRVQLDGPVQMLRSFIEHDDRKPLDRWLSEQNRYALAEARHLLEHAPGQLNRPDRIRRSGVLAPLLVFFYTLLVKGLILDGWPGWFYVLQRTLAEVILALRLTEARIKPPAGKTASTERVQSAA